jgi:hypothetical protein
MGDSIGLHALRERAPRGCCVAARRRFARRVIAFAHEVRDFVGMRRQGGATASFPGDRLLEKRHATP